MPRLAMALVVGAVLAGLAVPVAGNGDGSDTPGGVDQYGRAHDLTHPGRHTVIDFAAAWCEPCYHALPRIEALAAQHADIGFLVVSVDERSDGRDQLIERLGLKLPVIWDQDHSIIERFDPEGFPATYVLDPDGGIVYGHIGYSRAKIQALAELLAGLPDA